MGGEGGQAAVKTVAQPQGLSTLLFQTAPALALWASALCVRVTSLCAYAPSPFVCLCVCVHALGACSETGSLQWSFTLRGAELRRPLQAPSPAPLW